MFSSDFLKDTLTAETGDTIIPISQAGKVSHQEDCPPELKDSHWEWVSEWVKSLPEWIWENVAPLSHNISAKFSVLFFPS